MKYAAAVAIGRSRLLDTRGRRLVWPKGEMMRELWLDTRLGRCIFCDVGIRQGRGRRAWCCGRRECRAAYFVTYRADRKAAKMMS